MQHPPQILAIVGDYSPKTVEGGCRFGDRHAPCKTTCCAALSLKNQPDPMQGSTTPNWAGVRILF